jgi:CheY-like chemotaxis protein
MAGHAGSGVEPSPPDPPRVLVVDDDPAIRLICSTWLRLDGYEVLEAADGQQALELAIAEEPAVVLLDLSMPVLDGLGVAKALRTHERTRELPVVVLTAETDVRLAKSAYELGVVGFFTKPFDPAAVAEFVRDVIADVRAKAARPTAKTAGGHAF